MGGGSGNTQTDNQTPLVEMTETTATLEYGKLYKWGEVANLGTNCTVEIVYRYEGETYHQCGLNNGSPRFKGRPNTQKPWWQHDGSQRVNYTAPLSYNTFYSVATTRSGNVCKAFLNGVLNDNTTLDLTNNSGNALMGIGAGSETMTGKIYAIRIYNRVLSDNELLNNYNLDVKRFSELDYVQNGLISFYDAEFNSIEGHKLDTVTMQNLINPGTYDLTCNGGLENLYDEEKKGYVFPGQASANISFNALTTLDDTQEITYELVLRPTNITTTQRILYSYHNMEFFYRTGLNYALWHDGSSGGYLYADAPTNVLSTMAGTFKASDSKKYYLNSVLLNTLTAEAASQIMSTGSIGSGLNVYPLANGSIFYCFRVYNRQLTDEELVQNYNLDKQRFGE